MRIAVEHVLRMLAAGGTPVRLLQEYPLTGAGRHSSLPGLGEGDYTCLIAVVLAQSSTDLLQGGIVVGADGRRSVRKLPMGS